MTISLRGKIRLGLLLLFVLLLGCYTLIAHWGQPPARLGADILQPLLRDYQQQSQQRLQTAVANTRANQRLPDEFSAYWQQDGQTWQGSRRLPNLGETNCQSAPGNFITQVSTHRLQLYLCIQDGAQKRLFLLQLAQLLLPPQHPAGLRIGLLAPAPKVLLLRSAEQIEPQRVSIASDSAFEPVLTKPSGFVRAGHQDMAWLTTDYGWRLLLIQSAPSGAMSWQVPTLTLLLCLLLSWYLPLWGERFIYRRFAYLTKAAAQIALGDFSGRLPMEGHHELQLIHQVFNRMLDEIQAQKQQLREQNQELQTNNETLKETLNAVQSMQSERFVSATNQLQNAELQILRQALKLPLHQLADHHRQLQQYATQLDELSHQTALDRNQLKAISQGCNARLAEIGTQLPQLERLLQANGADKNELGEKQPFLLQPLLQQSVRQLLPQKADAEHQIYLRCPPGIQLNSYPHALSQVIQNLVSNSLHHGFAAGMNGEIIISVKQEAGQLILTYRDNGIGISEPMQAKLFQPFLTADSHNSGNSLGLYLTKQLVQQLLGGSIRYQASTTPGACFIITLPIDTSGQRGPDEGLAD
ncbi:MAG: HAMP domain-containing sensor histidine kinase [Aeromonadaceae bacterium]